MKSSIRVLAACLLIALPIAASAQTLRVGLVRLFKDQQQITVSATADVTISDPSGTAVGTAPASEEITLTAENGKIQYTRPHKAPTSLGNEVLLSSAQDGVIRISSEFGASAQYHGKIAVKVSGGALSLVNIVELEDYVRGVLPAEMSPKFNPEALKAQAVAARTYAWALRGQHRQPECDVCDSVHCQVYSGVSGEKPACSQAVNDTAGLIMVHKGKPIRAQYCSDCGGMTQDGAFPYLASVADRPEDGGPDYCEHKGHTWSKSWAVEEFAKLLHLSGPLTVKAEGSDSSGRVKQVAISAESGPAVVPGVGFRHMLGESVVKSTNFTIKRKNGSIIIEGQGSGHGIGLCQYGANGMAAAPYNRTFEQILKHYYKGIEILPISSVK